MKKLLFFWLTLSSVLSFAQIRYQPVTVSATGQKKVVARNLSIYPLTADGNTAFLTAVNAGTLPVKPNPAEGSIVGRYSYSFSDTRQDYQARSVVSDPAPVLADAPRSVPRLLGNYYPMAPQLALNTALYKRFPAFSAHSSKIIIYPGGLYSNMEDNSLMSRGWTHTSESAHWNDGQAYPTQFRRALEFANYKAAYDAAMDLSSGDPLRTELLEWSTTDPAFEGTHLFLKTEAAAKLYAAKWWQTFKQNDWWGAGVDYFSVNHEVFQPRDDVGLDYVAQWYRQVGWITKEIIRLAALEGKTLKSGMSDWGNLTHPRPDFFDDTDSGTGFPRYMSVGYIVEPYRGSSQSSPMGAPSDIGQLVKDGKAFVGVGSYVQHTWDEQSLFVKNTDGSYQVTGGELTWRTDVRTTTITSQTAVLYNEDAYKSQLKFYGIFARYCANQYFRAGGVHLPRSDVRQPGFENVRFLRQFRLDTESESGITPSGTGTTSGQFATLNSRPLNPDWTEADAIGMYLFTDYLRGWSDTENKTALGADNGKLSKARASVEMYTKGFHRAAQLNWIFDTPWTLIQPKLWIKDQGAVSTASPDEKFYRKPILVGGLATKDGKPTIWLYGWWPCQDVGKYTDVIVWVDKGSGVKSPGYRVRLKGRKAFLDYWQLPDALAGAQPKDVYFQFKSLLGEPITWRGDYREAKITSHPTPPEVIEAELDGGTPSVTDPGSSTVSAPTWAAALRYSYNGITLRLENTGGIGQMAIATTPATSFTINNPDGVPIVNNTFYGYGPATSDGYTRQWAFNHSPASFSITAQQEGNPSSTYSFTFTPSTSASNVVLVAPTSTTTTSGTATIAYNKVLVIGNSITTSWTTSDNTKGLDASAPEKDYFHILTNYLKTLNPGVDVRQIGSFASSGPFCGGSSLSYADGPWWEEHYWSLPGLPVYCGFTGTDSLDRYQALADFQADLIVMRIGENVGDLSHGFIYHYDKLIQKLKSKNPSARVVLTPSTWDGISSTQATLSSYIVAYGAAKGYPVASFAGLTGLTSGTLNHANDTGMQGIADRIWEVIPKSTTASGGGSTTVLAGNGYLPMLTYSDQGWSGSDVKTLENDQIVVEFRKSVGAAITSAKRKSNLSREYVNNYFFSGGKYDKGRSWQWADYATPGQAVTIGDRINVPGTGYDPVQGGSSHPWINPSPVLKSAIVSTLDRGNVFCAQIRPIIWNFEYELSNTVYDMEVWLNGSAICYKMSRTITERDPARVPEQRTFEAMDQEAPCTYSNPIFNRHRAKVNGSEVDLMNKGLNSINDKFFVDDNWAGTYTSDESDGLTHYTPANAAFRSWQQEFGGDDSFAYITANPNRNYDSPGVAQDYGYLILGSKSSALSKIATLPGKDQSFDFDFTQDNHNWCNGNGRVKRESGNLVWYVGDPHYDGPVTYYSNFSSPIRSWQASNIHTIEVTMAVTGTNQINLKWSKPGQDGTGDNEKSTPIPGIIGDGVERTYTISTSHPDWSGTINRIGFQAELNGTYATGAKAIMKRVRRIN